MLATVLFINYVDRGAVPTAAPLIQQDLHLTNEQLGRVFSAFFWVYALIQIPVGWLAERYGAHRVLAAGLIIWASAIGLTGATSSFAMLIALRMMLGLGESAGFPCVSKLLAAVVPIEDLEFLEKLEDEIDVIAAREALRDPRSIPWEVIKKKLKL